MILPSLPSWIRDILRDIPDKHSRQYLYTEANVTPEPTPPPRDIGRPRAERRASLPPSQKPASFPSADLLTSVYEKMDNAGEGGKEEKPLLFVSTQTCIFLFNLRSIVHSLLPTCLSPERAWDCNLITKPQVQFSGSTRS
ncbi:hypothetical protein E2C01_041624 [Portunus trituberculatus]|uniref:Uncharacterized protein n=1 Tax=Portunus trituberculatus TaxID=210409 RepID=A0A5B7FR56_PORTR|nr:hypothetical protein [Portunus trituberculatus]